MVAASEEGFIDPRCNEFWKAPRFRGHWMFHEHGHESTLLALSSWHSQSIRPRKDAKRHADLTDNDYGRGAFPFPLRIYERPTSTRGIRRIRISDIFIDASPTGREQRGGKGECLDGAGNPEIGSSVSWIASPFERRWATGWNLQARQLFVAPILNA